MKTEKKIYQVPEFTGANIPLKEAARIMNKDYQYVRMGIIEGILPIGTAFKMPNSSSYSFYISPDCSGNTRAMCTEKKRTSSRT